MLHRKMISKIRASVVQLEAMVTYCSRITC